MTIECFEQILYDDRVGEVVIVDDASTDGSYQKLVEHFKYEAKVKMYRNETNRDCYQNKKTAIELASNNWCCLWDSDNIFSTGYLDEIYKYGWNENIIYTPSFAAPHFDFSNFGGLLVTSKNITEHIHRPMFEVCLNACNYFVNRKMYLEVWDGSIDPITSDSIYFAYKWLESGKAIYIVSDLTYLHRVHPGSHYQNNVHRTKEGFHENILQKLKELR